MGYWFGESSDRYPWRKTPTKIGNTWYTPYGEVVHDPEAYFTAIERNGRYWEVTQVGIKIDTTLVTLAIKMRISKMISITILMMTTMTTIVSMKIHIQIVTTLVIMIAFVIMMIMSLIKIFIIRKEVGMNYLYLSRVL